MKAQVLSHLIHSRVGRSVLSLMQRVRLKKGKTTLFHVFAIFVQDITTHRMMARANGVAFTFTLSLFPGILFLFTLIPYIPIPDLDVQIMALLAENMPASTWEATQGTINDIVSNQRGDLLSFGFLFSLYLATNGMRSLIAAFSRSYKTGKRYYLVNLLVSMFLTLLLAATLFLGVIMLVVTEVVLMFLIEHSLVEISDYQLLLFGIGRFAVLLVLFVVGISLIYYYGPVNKKRWRFINIGSVFAGLCSIVASLGFTFYISNFASYNKLYGSIGALIAIMIWLFIISYILLIGYELNASVDKAVSGEKLKRFDHLDAYLRPFHPRK